MSPVDPARVEAAIVDRVEVARRYVDLTVAVVALEERIKNIAAAVDRVEEVLASTVSTLDRLYAQHVEQLRRLSADADALPPR